MKPGPFAHCLGRIRALHPKRGCGAAQPQDSHRQNHGGLVTSTVGLQPDLLRLVLQTQPRSDGFAIGLMSGGVV
jgi:hypothetical protein